jgi:hypothetical protein
MLNKKIQHSQEQTEHHQRFLVYLKAKSQLIIIYSFLLIALASSSFYALYRHNKAMTSLNKANEIMMTNTGIVIDSVDIQSFQQAELILIKKQNNTEKLDKIRNIFLYDKEIQWNNKNKITTNTVETNLESTTTNETN